MLAIVLGYRRYSFADDKTGELIEGFTLDYVDPFTHHLSEDRHGLPCFSISTRNALALEAVPGVYELDIQMRPGKGNKPTMTLLSAEFRGNADFVKIVKSCESGKAA